MSNLLDRFTDTNATSLASHTMDTGPGWTIVSGTWTIQSNKAVNSGGGNVISTATAADGTLQVVLTPPGSGTAIAALLFNWVDSSNWWLVYALDDAWRLSKNVASSFTDTIEFSTTNPLSVGGAARTLKVVTAGDNVKVYSDNTQIMDHTDSGRDLKTATIFGMNGNGTDTGTTFDDFSFVATAAVPNAPTSPTITNVTTTSFDYSFDDGGQADLTGGKFQYDTESDFSNSPVTLDFALGGGTITFLSAISQNVQYYGRFALTNASGTGAYSTGVAFEVLLPLVAPVLSLVSKTTTTITVSWTDATGGTPPHAYIVLLQNVDSIPDAFEYDDATSPLTSDPLLTPGATYTVVVWASDDDFATHVVSNEITVTTDAAHVTFTATVTTLVSDRPLPQSGFAGSTATPDQVGDSGALGYAQNAITAGTSAWDVVPKQSFTGTFKVGFPAFAVCASGIDYVTFAVNGGPWFRVSSMTANSDTENASGVGVDYDAAGEGTYSGGVVEYWTILDASDYGNNAAVVVRAIAYPVAGQPIVLPSLNLIANRTGAPTPVYVATNGNDTTGDGSSGNPYLTVVKGIQSQNPSACDDLIVYLKAGSYALGDTTFLGVNQTTGWIHVKPAPGLTRTDCILNGKTGTGIITAKVHYQNLTIQPTNKTAQSAMFNGSTGAAVWADGCNFIGPGQNKAAEWAALSPIYVTDCQFSYCMQAMIGNVNRNVLLDHTGQGGGSGATNFLTINPKITNTQTENFDWDTDQTIVSGTASGDICTLTVTNHGYETGDSIAVSGCTPSGYNDSGPDDDHVYMTITKINANSFSYRVRVAPVPADGPITVPGTVRLTTVFHGHFFQWFNGGNPMGTSIIYGMKGVSGGLRGGGAGVLTGLGNLVDTALVNCSLDNLETGNVVADYQNESDTTNHLIKNCTITGGCYWADGAGFTAVDVVVEGSTFPNMSNNAPHNDAGSIVVSGVHIR